MSDSKRFSAGPAAPTGTDALWRRLASAQDAALAKEPPAMGAILTPSGSALGASQTRRSSSTASAPVGRSSWRVGAVAAIGTLAAAAVLVVWIPARSRRLAAVAELNRVSQTVQTDALTSSPLQFSDGSLVTFAPASAGRMQRLTEARVELSLDHGRIDAHVVHAESTLWTIHAGPFEVRVTGTRFSVTWAAPRLEVEVYDGEVKVAEAGVAGAPTRSAVALRAGHRLIAGDGLTRTEELLPPAMDRRDLAEEAPPATTLPPAAPSPSPRTPVASPGSVAGGLGQAAAISTALSSAPSSAVARDAEWVVMAQRGAYTEAHSAASHLGWRSLCARLDARRLLLLGDVARYASAGDDARRAFESLVTRFPGDRLAADAEFSLGRLAFESGQTVDASRWFERYVTDWPKAALAEQALGRLVECAIRGNDSPGARRAANRYLQRAPRGPQAELARDVMNRLSVESP